MTIPEAIYCMESYLPESKDSCIRCKYYGSKKEGSIYVCKSSEAHKIAIEALKEKLKRLGEDNYGYEGSEI